MAAEKNELVLTDHSNLESKLSLEHSNFKAYLRINKSALVEHPTTGNGGLRFDIQDLSFTLN